MDRLLLIGATGLVGKQVLRLALDHPEVRQVVAPTRRPLAIHAKLYNPVVDFEALPANAAWWAADAVLCTLGTTIRQAGSQDRFRHIDYGYVMSVARLARQAGTPTFAITSSLGADPRSRGFYLRVKGQLERDLAFLGFPSLTIVRPSLLDGGPDKRPQGRFGEAVALAVARLLAPAIPPRYRAISTRKVAYALLRACFKAAPGTHIIESDQLYALEL